MERTFHPNKYRYTTIYPTKPPEHSTLFPSNPIQPAILTNTHERLVVQSNPKTHVDPSIFFNIAAIHLRSIDVSNSSKRRVFPYPISPPAIGNLPQTLCRSTSYRHGARLSACPDWTRLLPSTVPTGQQFYICLLNLSFFFLNFVC